jgi:hypothetical protein
MPSLGPHIKSELFVWNCPVHGRVPLEQCKSCDFFLRAKGEQILCKLAKEGGEKE